MKTRVAVVFGGRSGEHEISLRSAESVIAAMSPQRYEVTKFLIGKDGRWSPVRSCPNPERTPISTWCFPFSTGTFGEDGTMQGLFELADLPYVGANVLSSALSMDKDVMKRVCRDQGLPVIEHSVFRPRKQIEAGEATCDFAFPAVCETGQPRTASVGISKAHDCFEYKSALATAAQYDHKVIVERGIEGREFECGVLGNDEPAASIPCRSSSVAREFYDYEDKYELDLASFDASSESASDGDRRNAAPRLSNATKLWAAKVWGAWISSREESTGKIYINEINTIPGFTSISMYPKMWAYTGIPYADLIDRLIELALERHARKKATRFTR